MKLRTKKSWEKIGKFHHHGINIPLSAIWTKKSCGNGEFFDLLPLIDFLSEIKFDILQLLPLNDTGLDPSPYNAVSSIGLHPIYISLHSLPYIPENLKAEIKSLQQLTYQKQLPYSDILNKKYKWLKEYLKKVGSFIKQEKNYQPFIQSNSWLTDYALFKILKKKNNNLIWQNWPANEKILSSSEKNQLISTYKEKIEFYCTVQYLCHTQLSKVKSYAERKNVFLKGDIPILVSSDSADVWAYKEFFNLNLTLGSPPNKFDSKGQIWNLPLYNWNTLEKDHFNWWKKRIQHAERYFHIFRIDHILGFFRAWAIPQNLTPKEGYFIPCDESLMEAQGRLLLKELISFSDMLPIGENLGDPPDFVGKIMKEYGIAGTHIFYRYRNWKKNGAFIPVENYPPESLSCVSTHDIETVNIWWRKFPEDAKKYAAFKKWIYSPSLTFEQNYSILHDCHHSGSFFHINLLQEYLALIPSLTWKDPYDERINVPGTISQKNWTYRYKLSLDVLLKNKELKTLLKKLIL